MYIQSWTETSERKTCVSVVHMWCLISLALDITELRDVVNILKQEWSKHMGDTKHEFDEIGSDV